MMSDHLTLMAVHAHPDDEAIGTGGVLAKYAEEGIRTVLVTCTNGECGDAPGGIKPDADGHDGAIVAELRRQELQKSAEVLGITHLEMLGYHDSGMMGWPQNELPNAFWNTPVDDAAAKLAALMEQYRPDVVVTYDQDGFYGHPDHIQANRITHRAIELCGIPAKLYYTAVAKEDMEKLARRVIELLPEKAEEWKDWAENAPFGCDAAAITTRIDASAYTGRKRDAMAVHASQSETMEFLSFPEAMFNEIFREECFIRVLDKTQAPTPESDLFAGLR